MADRTQLYSNVYNILQVAHSCTSDGMINFNCCNYQRAKVLSDEALKLKKNGKDNSELYKKCQFDDRTARMVALNDSLGVLRFCFWTF